VSCVRCWRADSGTTPLCRICEAELDAEQLAEQHDPPDAGTDEAAPEAIHPAARAGRDGQTSSAPRPIRDNPTAAA
jgi:hypothetical protein